MTTSVFLNNDRTMPLLGLGLYKTTDAVEAEDAIAAAVQKGISVIPKSVHPERIASNARIFDFTIDQEDMDLLDTLNQNYHSAYIPEDLRDIVF